MLVRRRALGVVGLLDENYFLHCEDLDWCFRFRQMGLGVLFVPTVRVFHEKGRCSRARPVEIQWHLHKGMVRYFRKNFRDAYPLPLMGFAVLGVWLRFAMVALPRVAWIQLTRRFSAR